MSRAFIKESDELRSSDELPERSLSDLPNYVTPRGLELLQMRQRALRHEHAQLATLDDVLKGATRLEIERDLRYYNAQLNRAIVIDSATHQGDEVRFGASVTFCDDAHVHHVFHLVGEDEADVTSGYISWASPLGKALLGARVGELLVWKRPGGSTNVEIIEIRYTRIPPGATEDALPLT